MDNVACYGSEAKLIDCSYYMNTNEDDHINDIWIDCDATIDAVTSANSNETSTSTTSTIALAVALIALCISFLVTALLIGYILYSHKSKTPTQGG